MKALVLRKCYVNDTLWTAGTIVTLPCEIDMNRQGMEKNFRPVDIPPSKPEPVSSPSSEATEASEPELYVSDKPYKSKKKKR